MLTKISWILATAVLSDFHNPSTELRKVYAYGCELFLYTIISTLGLLMIGSATNRLYNTVIVIIIFYLCQSNGGGYHATTHTRCFLTMSVGLLFSLLLIHADLSRTFYVALLLLSTVALMAFPLHLHPNKHYMSKSIVKLTVRSRLITVCIVFCIIVIYACTSNQIIHSGSVALFVSALSRLYACLGNDM